MGRSIEPSVVRVAAVQALAHTGEAEYRNVSQALAYAEQAAAEGAELVIFPEAYPGPATGPLDWGGRLDDPVEQTMARLARRLGVHLIWGGLESSAEGGRVHVSSWMCGPDGQQLAHYRRVQPDNPDLNDFFFGRRDVVPGDEIVVAESAVGRIGLQICGELWVPEISRVQMLRGAEILTAPVNGRPQATRLNGIWKSWQHIARARAAENLVYVVVPQKFLVDGPLGGVAMIAGPEAMLARSTRPGVLVADLDLERLRWLRARLVDAELLCPPTEDSPASATRCGQHLDRRPDLYGELATPQPAAYDYRYYEQEGDA